MANEVVAHIRAIARRRRVSKSVEKAAYETGRVESNFTNPAGGDADSEGWRQERKQYYKDPRNLDASINRFFDEATKADHGQPSYEIAAAVQRPAAQYRGRYKDVSREAQDLLGAGGPSKPPASHEAGAPTAPTLPGVSAPAMTRQAALRQYVLAQDSPDEPNSVMNLAGALKSAAESSASPPPRAPDARTALITRRQSAGGPTRDTSTAAARAETIDSKHLPYLWGGGHGGKVDAAHATPLDCSGAVSAVLGINPRVAAQFESFGSPGDGGSKGITIYAKDTHVIMKINGHFFGTSATNPGGGAGWIPAGAISKQYLGGFHARHLAGS